MEKNSIWSDGFSMDFTKCFALSLPTFNLAPNLIGRFFFSFFHPKPYLNNQLQSQYLTKLENIIPYTLGRYVPQESFLFILLCPPSLLPTAHIKIQF